MMATKIHLLTGFKDYIFKLSEQQEFRIFNASTMKCLLLTI